MPKITAFSELYNIFDKKSGMKQIIGIGNALVDIMTLIDDDRLLEQLSLPKGSMQLVDQDRSVQIHNETARFESTKVRRIIAILSMA